MRVVVLGYPGLQKDHNMIVDAGVRVGVEVALVNPNRLSATVDAAGTRALHDGQPIAADVIIPRGVNRIYPFLTTWLRAAETAGSRVVNNIDAAAHCLDKLVTLHRLAHHRVPFVPATAVIAAPSHAPISGDMVEKPAFGSGGGGVRISTYIELGQRFAIEHAQPAPAVVEHTLLQPLVRPYGSDYRVIIAGGEIVGGTHRTAPAGKLVTNGTDSTITVCRDNTILETGKAAADALGLEFAGVDIIDWNGTPAVLEVNCWPGLAVTSNILGHDLGETLLRTACRGR